MENPQLALVRRLLLLAALLAGMVLSPSPAHAATLTVTKLTDTNDGVCDADCSLREAVAAAASGDTVTFAAGLTGAISLTLGQIGIGKDLTIQGPGASLLTISGGSAYYGGALYNDHSALTIRDISFSGNSANYGNAIYNHGGALIIANSTFSGNSYYMAKGGAIDNEVGAVSVTNSTFSNNSALYGGAISNTGGNFTIVDSTFSGNSASFGSNIFIIGGFLTLINSPLDSGSIDISGGSYGSYNSGGGAASIDPGPAAKLSFVYGVGTNVNVSAPLFLRVAVQDSSGKLVGNDTSTQVTVGIKQGTGSPGAVLSGTTTRTAYLGIATFDDVRIDLAGSGYVLTATVSSLTAGDSNAFNVVAPATPTPTSTPTPTPGPTATPAPTATPGSAVAPASGGSRGLPDTSAWVLMLSGIAFLALYAALSYLRGRARSGRKAR